MDITFGLILMLALFFVIGGGLITAIIMMIEVRKHRPVKMATDASHYIDMGETQMTVSNDSFLRTHSTRVKVSSSSKK